MWGLQKVRGKQASWNNHARIKNWFCTESISFNSISQNPFEAPLYNQTGIELGGTNTCPLFS